MSFDDDIEWILWRRRHPITSGLIDLTLKGLGVLLKFGLLYVTIKLAIR